jgi:hypothetical protein
MNSINKIEIIDLAASFQEPAQFPLLNRDLPFSTELDDDRKRQIGARKCIGESFFPLGGSGF